MRKLSLLLVLAMFIGLCPVKAADNTLAKYSFTDKAEIESFETFYGSTLAYDAGAAKLSNAKGNTAAARFDLDAHTLNVINIEQIVRIENAKEAQIRVLSGGKATAVIKFAGGEIKALGKDGYVKLRSYSNNKWYKVQFRINVAVGVYEVTVDGIKLGGSVSCIGANIKPDAVQYIVSGTPKTCALQLDDISVYEQQQKAASVSSGNEAASARSAYYNTYKPDFDAYEKPSENVVAGEWVTGEVEVSSTADGFSGDAIIDGNRDTKWQAAPAQKPVDYGKSLVTTKPQATEGQQAIRYNFPPQKGTIVLEQDILLSEVAYETAIPYILSSNDQYTATLIVSSGNFSIAGTSATYKDVAADQWYHFKFVLNTVTDTYDLYIDDKLWLEAQPFRADVEDVSKIMWYKQPRALGGMALDNIKLYTLSPLGYFEEMIYEENFEGYPEGTEELPSLLLSPSTSGNIEVKKYSVEAEEKFPQTAIVDVGRESEFEGAYLDIPEDVYLKYTLEVARPNRNFTTIIDRRDEYHGGEQFLDFSPLRGQYLRVTIYDAVDAMGNPAHAQLSEMKIIQKHKKPVENLAFTANVEVSGSSAITYDKRGINDNIAAEFGNIGNWHSGKEDDKWVELSWADTQSIGKIILHDSASLYDHTKGGVLTFDDGSKIEVDGIANSGMPKIIEFPEKRVKKIRFTITDYEGTANLSEFMVFAPGAEPMLPEYVEPDEIVTLDPEYFSRWCSVTDVDNDGELEYISARLHELKGDSHYTTSICVQKKDGTRLWVWGDPTNGSHVVGSDVAMQVHDIDNDGKLEIIASTEKELLIFNAATGEILKTYPLPVSNRYPSDLASDTIIIADISGKGYPSDIMVKNRYRDVWAYTSDWELIWHVCMPNDKKVGHYPQPIDIDNDGHDEVIVGYACIDEDGSIVWDMKQEQYPGQLEEGHKDSLSVVRFVLTGDTTGEHIINEKDLELLEKHISGEKLLTGDRFLAGDTNGDGKIDNTDKTQLEQKLAGELKAFANKGLPRKDQRFAMTPCGGGSNTIMIDGNGDRVWALDNAMHVETVEEAHLGLTEHPYELIISDMGVGAPASGILIVDLDGNVLAHRYSFERIRQYHPINWEGEGKPDYFLMPTDNVVLDGNFNVKVKPLMPKRAYDTFGMKSYQTGSKNYTCDMDGDGTTDIVLLVHDEGGKCNIYTYYNKRGAKVADGIGRGHNISQY